ncbi:hypothetical protein [Micromonospora mirobrigensis]|uniref:Uncharacterized protein n=1 Tax=Micromonospora mirobrigensis TaxID=262898 RepID=A0A1C4XHL2_9ACTN|nr:hypothetical protein [Micromonospora mirobrigensis]SCF07923.1 hypothetical protein GA0070564_10399 [Micromonospora mirobrigensis]
MPSEVLFFSGVAIVLSAGGVLLGSLLAHRRRLGLLPLMGVLLASVTALTVITGPLGARSLAVVLAAVLWSAVLLTTVLLLGRLRPGLAIALGVVGGVVAIHASVIAFVAARFTATEAPREYALLWRPAVMTGGARDLGGPGGDAEMPLWARMSQDAGLLSLLLVMCSGVAVSYVVRRATLARSAKVLA